MADQKISALPASTTPLAGTEVLPVVQSGATKKVSVANLTAGRAVSTGALSVVGADATLDNAYFLKGKLVAGSALQMIGRNASDQVAIDPDGYGTVIGYGGRYNFAGSGNFTCNIGNIVIGTSGKGIDFSADSHAAGMTSELLDDYEEGTWTPATFTNWSTVPTVSNATYTKIGRQVTVRMQGLNGVAAANSKIAGLPFTSGSASPAVFKDHSGNTKYSLGGLPGSATQIDSMLAVDFTGTFWSMECTYFV